VALNDACPVLGAGPAKDSDDEGVQDDDVRDNEVPASR